jgi:hypothetical protein
VRLHPDRRRWILVAILGPSPWFLSGCCDVTDIQQESLPDGIVGQAYSFELQHNCEGKLTEEQIAWRVVGDVPPGISFSSSGKFSGTPTSAGTFSFMVEVFDTLLFSAGVLVTKEYVLTVRPTPYVLPVAGARAWAAALPDARLLLLEGIGHFPT